MDIFKTLCELSVAQSFGSQNDSAHKMLKEKLSEYGEAYTDNLGNVICKVGEFSKDKETILLDAHIDEIGFVVSYICEGGFLKLSACGGIDKRVLAAQDVVILGRKPVNAVISSTPPHLESDRTKAWSLDDLYADTGLGSDELKDIVSLGDFAYIKQVPQKLLRNKITGKALDNRAGCVCVLKTLELLKGNNTKYNVAVMFSVQEELGLRGAKASAVDCDKAVIVDVSFAKTTGESDKDCGELGKGPMIGFSPSLCRELSEEAVNVSEKNNIPYQLEVMSGRTGTNADEIGVFRNGVKTLTVSIPLKHMHTPVESVDVTDIENSAKLIASMIINESEAENV